jgi:hypothetical protein
MARYYRSFREFYQVYPQIRQTASDEFMVEPRVLLQQRVSVA